MIRFKSIFAAAITVAIAIAGVSTHQASAQAPGQGSASLSIAPKKTYNVKSGESVKDTLIIRNLDRSSDLNLSLRTVDFTFTDQGGIPKLYLGEGSPQTTWSLKPYLKMPKTVKIPKGGSKTVDISVDIPKNRGAGSLYSAIVYSTSAPDGGNVGLAASGVTLVFANIPGKVNQDLKLEKLGAYLDTIGDKPAGYTFLTNDEPKKIGYTLKNNGNVTESPTGAITVKNRLFGQQYDITNVNPNGSLALIDQTRLFTSCIKLADETVKLQGTETQTKTCASPGLWPGLYSVDLELYYGQNGNITREIRGAATFWFLPLWFIVLVLVLLVILGLLIWRLTVIVRRKFGKGNYKKSSRRK